MTTVGSERERSRGSFGKVGRVCPNLKKVVKGLLFVNLDKILPESHHTACLIPMNYTPGKPCERAIAPCSGRACVECGIVSL
jgi:hypothetical protein